MNFNEAFFEAAFGSLEQMPPSDMPEVCFSGRSNVGKSSLINKVLNRKNLARVSQTPGKTVTINFYRLPDFRLCDLPGYGYAKVPFKEKSRWAELMEGYFRSSRDIRLVLQLADMRHKITDYDISMLEFLKYYGIPYAVVLTKCDKLNKSEFENRLKLATQELGELAENVPIIPFSALKGIGTQQVRDVIEEYIKR